MTDELSNQPASQASRMVGRFYALLNLARYVTEDCDPSITDPIRHRLAKWITAEQEGRITHARDEDED